MTSSSQAQVKFTSGQQVLVTWHGFEQPLSGTFIEYAEGDRPKVKMDNGFHCEDMGFNPDCVKAA